MSNRTQAVALLLVVGVAGLLLCAGATTAGEPVRERQPGFGIEGSRSHNFLPGTYALLAERTQGAAAITQRSSHGVIGTGVLLASDLALTCRHATHRGSGVGARRAPKSLEVSLEVSDDAGTPTYNRFPVLAYVYTSERLDVCVLRVGPDESGVLPAPSRAQRLSARRVPPGCPLYVVHHPRGRRLQVADGGRVLFPFEATDRDLAALVARTRRDASSAVEGNRFAREIQLSYCRTDGGSLRNYSRRWAGQPVIGADCMTMDGSSGAPVYDKRTHDLVGIVFAGVDQSRRRISSRWEQHEAILPAIAILEEFACCPCAELRRLAASAGVTNRAQGALGKVAGSSAPSR